MKKEKQLLLALICGLDMDHKLIKTAGSTEALSDTLLRQSRLTKDDLFEASETGQVFFDHREVWPKLPAIIEKIKETGETIDASDFQKKPAGAGDKTILELAEKHDALVYLFHPRIWKNNLAEMEKLWFFTKKASRTNLDFTKLRQNIARDSGIQLREERLSYLGMPVGTLRTELREGAIEEVDSRLRMRGDRFRKEDLFLIDGDGETVLDNRRTWDSFDKIVATMQKHGDFFTAADLKSSRGDGKSALARAGEFDKLDKVFTPVLWKSRIDEMMALWDSVPLGQKSSVKINTVIAALEDDSFSDMIDPDKDVTLVGLINPHHPKLSTVRSEEGDYTIRPLGLQKTWHHIWDIEKALEARGEHIGLDHLRLPHGWFGQSCLHAAASYGFTEVVVDLLKKNGEWFSADDLLAKKTGHESVLDIISRQDKLDVIMKPELWLGRADTLIKVWDTLPIAKQNKYDMEDMLSKINLLSLRQAARARTPVAQP